MTDVIAVAGPVGAGKTSLVTQLAARLREATVFHVDDYEAVTVQPLDMIVAWMQRGGDFDEFDLTRLASDLDRRKRGQRVIAPRTGRELPPGKYTLLETPFGRAHQATGRHIDLLFWLDVPLDISLARKTREIAQLFLQEEDSRRCREGLRWLRDYLDNYLSAVADLLRLQEERVKAGADVVLDGRRECAALVELAQTEILRRCP